MDYIFCKLYHIAGDLSMRSRMALTNEGNRSTWYTQDMSRKGNLYDTVVIGCFFGIMESE